jgi:putative ABC transport system substrate-binding protein
MSDRRAFLLLLGLSAAAPSILHAQQAGKVVRIGWLGNSPLDSPETLAPWDAFRSELQKRGWSEGRNLVFVTRFAAGVAERQPQNVRELIDANVDLIVATSGPAVRAAKQATDTIPVIFASITNPVEQGLVSSLARPGGNLTGLTTLGPDLAGKRLQLLKEAVPAARRVGILTHPSANIDNLVVVAGRLDVQLLRTGATRAEDIASAMHSLSFVDAWFVDEMPLYFTNRKTIIDLAREQRKPAMYASTFFVDAGGLMSYSVGQRGQYRRLADIADRILRGAKPADLPVEQPTEFELAINMKAANSIGLKIPPALLARADRVIE